MPDVLLIDFVIGDALGTHVAQWFANHTVRPGLFAHSSLQEANLGMVREGADFYLENIKYRPSTESITKISQTMKHV